MNLDDPLNSRTPDTPLNIVIIGLSLSSSWGNGHATTYRSLIKGLHQEGHQITFLEHQVEWYANNRDLTRSPHCDLHFYDSPEDLFSRYAHLIREVDMVIAGSYLQQGVEICRTLLAMASGVTAFYDIDTPVTLDLLTKRRYDYITPELIPDFDLYLSFSGGAVLERLETDYGARRARALFCSVDPDLYHPEPVSPVWRAGYLGTWSSDRQPGLKRLLLDVADQRADDLFVVAGPQYPAEIEWPDNVERIEHLPPPEHRTFYNRQQFTINVTRQAMVKAGFSPSVRLFEAAACGVPIISDTWEGLDQLFEPGRDILIAESTEDVLRYLETLELDESRQIGERARQKILSRHSSRQRARQLTGYYLEAAKQTVTQSEHSAREER